MRNIKGNAPAGGKLLASNGKWEIYIRTASSTDKWIALKVIRCDDKGSGKANYWIGWNGERLARGSEEAALNAHHPKVYDWVVKVLSGN